MLDLWEWQRLSVTSCYVRYPQNNLNFPDNVANMTYSRVFEVWYRFKNFLQHSYIF